MIITGVIQIITQGITIITGVIQIITQGITIITPL
jgi:hypothetical protein